MRAPDTFMEEIAGCLATRAGSSSENGSFNGDKTQNAVPTQNRCSSPA